MWVNTFQTHEIQAGLSSFFVMIMIHIACGSNKGGGWKVGTIKEQKWKKRQLKARHPVWGLTGPFLCSQHSKLEITEIGQPFMACPVLQAPIQESHDHLMAPKCHLRLTQGLRKAATEIRLVTVEHLTQWNIIVH